MFGRLASLVAAGAMTLALGTQTARADHYRSYTGGGAYRTVEDYRSSGYNSGYDRSRNTYRSNSYARCEGEEWSNDRLLGTALGAILGGAIGSQFGEGKGKTAATIAGIFVGGFAGNRLANNMSCSDQRYAQNTYYRAYEYGRPGERYGWSNPNNRRHYGYVTPSRWYQDNSGQRCREYTQTIYVDGRRQTATGTACRKRDGSWQIMS